MIKAVIFDLDGVIVSTDELHYLAWKQLADKENILFDGEINNQLRGISRMESLDIILRKSNKSYSQDEKEAMATFKNDIYKESLDILTRNDILPGVSKILDELREKGIKLAIGSSSRNAKKILEKIGLRNFFDAVSDGTNISKSKPHPEVFEKAAEMLGLFNTDCAVVEDAISGIEAAKACHMLAFAVGDAKQSPIKDYDFEDLLKIIELKLI